MMHQMLDGSVSFAVDAEQPAPMSPVKVGILARTNKPVDLGECGIWVHDFSSMKMAEKIPVDYAHDDDEILGYATMDKVDAAGLWLSGTLLPYKDDDMASEVVYKSKGGLPYQASIFHDGDFDMVEIPYGATGVANGTQVVGPAYIVVNWTLRGVAVCPYGADKNTSTVALKSKQVKFGRKASLDAYPQYKATAAINSEDVKMTQEQEPKIEAAAAPEVATEVPAPVIPELSREEFSRIKAEFGLELAAEALEAGHGYDWAKARAKELSDAKIAKEHAELKIRNEELVAQVTELSAKLHAAKEQAQLSAPGAIKFDAADKKPGKVTSIFKKRD